MRGGRNKIIIAACLLVLALSAAPAQAIAHVEVAELGSLSATFSYQQRPNGYGGESTSGLRLAISRSGAVVYSAPVSSPSCPEEGCGPAYYSPDVHIALVEAGQEPKVVLDLFTGGAHCCNVEQVFSGPGPNGVTMIERDFGSIRPRQQPLGPGAQVVFISADDRFEGVFTDDADSAQPVQVWALGGGVFRDVTRHYPSLIAADAGQKWRSFKRARRNNNVGDFAGWAADEYLLGRSPLVNRRLEHLVRVGGLAAAGGSERGRRFARDLKSDLRQWGYAR